MTVRHILTVVPHSPEKLSAVHMSAINGILETIHQPKLTHQLPCNIRIP